jgi:hypothetical protein
MAAGMNTYRIFGGKRSSEMSVRKMKKEWQGNIMICRREMGSECEK